MLGLTQGEALRCQKSRKSRNSVFSTIYTPQFDVPEAIRGALESQLSLEDQDRVERFTKGFRIEDWFEWIFSNMPWVKLIHGLDQTTVPNVVQGLLPGPGLLAVGRVK